MLIISQNVYGVRLPGTLKRIDLLVPEYLKHAPDIIALQEVHTKGVFDHLNKLLAAYYPHAYYTRKLKFQESGLVVFSKRPFDSLEHIPFAPVCRGMIAGKAFGGRHKGALVLRRQDLTVIVTHTSPNKGWDWSDNNFSEEVQRRQVNVVLEQVHAAKGPLIVCGDFNIGHDSGLYHHLLTDGRLVDPFLGEPTFVSRHGNKHCIDYILTRRLKTSEAEVLLPSRVDSMWNVGPNGALSDHAPLKLRVEHIA